MNTTAEDIEALASAYLEAIEAGDAERVRSMYAPDAVLWHNVDRREQTVDDSLAVFRWLSKTLTKRCYTEVRRTVLPDGYVQQHVLTGITPTGARWELPAMMRVWVNDARIARVEEYFDSGQLAAMLR